MPDRVARLLIVSLLFTTGCTTYRTIRWRDPMPYVHDRIFDQRVVEKAAVPFQFARAAKNRDDLDTLPVRDVDGTMKRFDAYMTSRHIRGFVVIRNDTIIYERYSGELAAGDRWNSASMAKSVTSMLLGIALSQGVIGSLDDLVTKYVPEGKENPAFAGVTLRHLLGMRSGFAYTRTNGSMWHDLRSGDAHFFYTTNRTSSLLGQSREDPPGSRWAYKDSDTDLLALVLVRATGKSLAKQLEENVWTKIGTEANATYNLDHRDGLEDAASGLNATGRDYARLGRLMLNGGRWNGSVLIDSAWVHATTRLDTNRTEPEVVTWYRMQHTGYWWIPMQNWNAEQDFFADGSRGQRIYVHPPTHTVIVQLAEESNQEFPFRKITHYLAGEPYRYPTGIAGMVLQAGRVSTDSATRAYERLSEAALKQPANYTVNEAGIIAVAATLRSEGHAQAADAVLLAASRRYAKSSAFQNALREANLTPR